MTYKIKQAVQGFNAFFTNVRNRLLEIVQAEIEQQLEQEVTQWLYRSHHERRTRINRQSQAVCQGCGSQAARQFMRNGHRKRQMVTSYGVVNFRLPRVVCECGGSVKIPFSILRPYQQIWDDVGQQIQRWADFGLSLRQMQTAIGDQSRTQVGLCQLNKIVHDVRQIPATKFSSVPPIIMLDAIWLTLLEETGHCQHDRLKRHRCCKSKHKVCVLVALGLYPQSGRWGILDWQVTRDESQAAWESLLLPLEARGIYRQRGVELFIHDGGKGLLAALELLYPHIPHQRCMFHKLRNLWHSIQVPDGLSPKQRRQFKRTILQQVHPIFEAPHAAAATALRDAISRRFRHSQPTFVATLQRDWHQTIAFFRVLNRFPQWNRRFLRTTSLLERVNRMLRRLFRPKAAFHSLSGLSATVARVLHPKRLF